MTRSQSYAPMFSWLFCAALVASAPTRAGDTDYQTQTEILERAQSDINDFVQTCMTCPSLQALGSQLYKGHLPYLPFELPKALLVDGVLFCGSAMVAAALETRVVLKKAALAIDLCMHNHEGKEPSILLLDDDDEGVKVGKYFTSDKDKTVSREVILAIAYATVARDSQFTAPHDLVVDKQTIKREHLMKATKDDRLIRLFDQVSKAAERMLDKEIAHYRVSDMMGKIFDELITPSSKPQLEIYLVAEHLKRAAKIALELSNEQTK